MKGRGSGGGERESWRGEGVVKGEGVVERGGSCGGERDW